MDNFPEITMVFGKRPSGFAGVAKALWNRKHVRKNRKCPGQISADVREVTPDPSHVQAFNRICKVPDTGFLHPLYPLSYVYPLMVRVLGHKKSGFNIFKSLNVRSWINQYRKIKDNETLTFHCTIKERRILEKGLELDVAGEVTAGGQSVWSCCYTFFEKGRFGEPSAVPNDDVLPEIREPAIREQWFLEKGDGFRFAKISGDTNGIHYWDAYARMLGFKHSFAQPVLVLGRSHESIPLTNIDSFSFEQRLKGPVYYNSRIIIKGGSDPTDNGRYDIYCEDNEKPCIRCHVRRMS